MSEIMSLNWRDLVKGLTVAVFTAIITTAYGVTQNPTFSFSDFHWQDFVKVAIATLIAYLAKNFSTDSNGKLFGKI